MHRPACASPGCRRHGCEEHRTLAPLPPALPADLRISYRQLDYWARCGYLRPTRPRWGSGITRTWPPTEIEIARAMTRLIHAGLELNAAARIAREAITAELDTVPLRGGIWLTLAHEPAHTLTVAATG